MPGWLLMVSKETTACRLVLAKVLLGWRIQSRTADPVNTRVPSDPCYRTRGVNSIVLGVPDRPGQQEPNERCVLCQKIVFQRLTQHLDMRLEHADERTRHHDGHPHHQCQLNQRKTALSPSSSLASIHFADLAIFPLSILIDHIGLKQIRKCAGDGVRMYEW